MTSACAAQPKRSWLITSALATGRYPAARGSGADVAMVDLEDSVAAENKETARRLAAGFFEDAGAGALLGVRMNSPLTPAGVRDLVAIGEYPAKPDIVLAPKVESPRDIEFLAATLDTDDYRPEIWALIETPRAIDALSEIVRAQRLGGCVFGAADYAAAMGCSRTWEGLLYARSVLVNGAGALSIPVVDSPYFDLDDPDGLRRETERAKELGFIGKGAVHPRQLEVIDEVFAPSAEELAAARAVVAAADETGGASITTVAGQMIGPPLVAAARAVIGRQGEREH